MKQLNLAAGALAIISCLSNARADPASTTSLYASGMLFDGSKWGASDATGLVLRGDAGVDLQRSCEHFRVAAALSVASRTFWGYGTGVGIGGRVEWLHELGPVRIGLSVAAEHDLRRYEEANRFTAGVRVRSSLGIIAGIDALWVPAHHEADPDGFEDYDDIVGIVVGVGFDGIFARL